MSGANDEFQGLMGLLFGYVLTGYYVVALLLAFWAANNDETSRWARVNITVVVLAPVLIAAVGFVADGIAVVNFLRGLVADVSGV